MAHVLELGQSIDIPRPLPWWRLDAVGLICLTKYIIHLIPECPLWQRMAIIWSREILFIIKAHIGHDGLTSTLIASCHHYSTLMSLSVWFWSDIIKVRDNLYFWTNFSSVQSHLQISILLPTLVCSDAFLVRVIDTHQCTHAKSMNRCNSIALHCSA